MTWGTPQEIETRRRIRLSVWAYAYEFENETIVSDAKYDVESFQVNLNIETGRLDLDFWFRAMFTPDTGIWIHKHPELVKVRQLYERWYK